MQNNIVYFKGHDVYSKLEHKQLLRSSPSNVRPDRHSILSIYLEELLNCRNIQNLEVYIGTGRALNSFRSGLTFDNINFYYNMIRAFALCIAVIVAEDNTFINTNLIEPISNENKTANDVITEVLYFKRFRVHFINNIVKYATFLNGYSIIDGGIF